MGELIMWKLTITRTYDKTFHDGTEMKGVTESLVYKAFELMSLAHIVDATNTFATDGVYSYKIEFVKGEE